MNIIVCVKPVPLSADVKINTDTNTVIREGVKSDLNPFDWYAVEEALLTREKLGGTVTVISMGPPSTENTIKKSVSLGVDDVILLTDPAFAGSDTLATAYTLAQGIKTIGEYDLIICGKQAIDGDTAQVGPSLAEKLKIPHAASVKKVSEIGRDFIKCRRLTSFGQEDIYMPLPALITVEKEINNPRLPSVRGAIKARKTSVKKWNIQTIGAEKELCGLKGSPTRVVKVFTPSYDVRTEIIDGQPREQARQLLKIIAEKNLKSF